MAYPFMSALVSVREESSNDTRGDGARVDYLQPPSFS